MNEAIFNWMMNSKIINLDEFFDNKKNIFIHGANKTGNLKSVTVFLMFSKLSTIFIPNLNIFFKFFETAIVTLDLLYKLIKKAGFINTYY